MPGWIWLLVAIGGLLVVWIVALLILALSGRTEQARALLRFIPDCVVLLRRLSGEGLVSRRAKVLIALTVAYLAFPLDPIPDFIPVIGHLDDALVLLLTLRAVLRGLPAERVDALWPGPPGSLATLRRIAQL